MTALTPLGQTLARLLLGLVLGGALVGAGVRYASLRHEATVARQDACRARVEAVIARNPILRKGLVLQPDECRNLATLVGEVLR